MARGFIQGFVEQGGNVVVTDGRSSTTRVQKSFPLATVSVFNAGTAVLSSIFSDSGGTPKANPFVAGTDGSWSFWANPGLYDVQFSGAGITSPFSFFNLFANDTAITAPLPDPGANGVLVRTALQTLVSRTITGTANEITLTNGNGVAGSPTVSLPGALTFTGKTIVGGAYTPTTISGGTHTSITSLSIRSSGAAFDTALAVTEVLTANRTLTITLNDTNRTLNLGGNLTTANSFTTAGNNALTLTTTGGTNVTLPVTGTLATLAGTETFTNKTLTSPRIGTALLDTNGNEVIETPATAAAVNQLRVTNSATGNPVIIGTQGDDAAVGLIIAAKAGGGSVTIQTLGGDRIVQTADNQLYFGNGVVNAAPTSNHILQGTGGSGTNIGGTHLDLSGGKGTGNAEPGQLAVRYPLRGAGGTTLQSLSTDRFPVSTALFTNTSDGTPVANSVAETSLFTGVTGSAGSTRTIEAGISKAGTAYRVTLYLAMNTSGTPTLRIKLKAGSVLLVDTGAAATPNNVAGIAILQAIINVQSIGAAGVTRTMCEFNIYTALSGSTVATPFVGATGSPAVDFTVNQTIDATAQWGTASASNTINILSAVIERIR